RLSNSETHELLHVSSMRKDLSRDLGLGNGDSAQAPSPNPQALQRDTFWRSLEEKAGDPAFQERLYNEFPSQIEAITDPVQRRTFLKVMGASLQLVSVS